MDIKKIISRRVGIYERKIEVLQEKIMLLGDNDTSKLKEDMMKWYYRDEELLDLLQEIVRREKEDD